MGLLIFLPFLHYMRQLQAGTARIASLRYKELIELFDVFFKRKGQMDLTQLLFNPENKSTYIIILSKS